MRATHTSGPWRYEEGRIVAGYRPEESEIVHEMGLENEGADARLIAASPDLLAALKQCLGDLDAEYNSGGNDWFVSRSMARAAIAKAIGEPE